VTKYKGKNKNKSIKNQTIFRAKYLVSALKGHDSITNFNFSERNYYGRVDLDDDPVIPKEGSLVPLASDALPGEIKMVLPFVRDMFQDFRSKFQQAMRIGKLPLDDPCLSDIVAHKAYQNPVRIYNLYIAEVVESYNNEYLSIIDNARKVMNFNDYVKHFIRFIKILGKNFPVTLTAFQKSQRSNVFTDGLTINIANLDCSDDELKEAFFVNNFCINFFLNAAKQYGFAVTKNAPWILVADLASVSTQLYLKKYNLPTVRKIFDNYYTKTYTLDLTLLPSILQRGYNSFCDVRKYEKDFIICKKYTNANNVYRQKVNNSTLNIKYNLNYWLPIYINIRNYEEKMTYTEPEIFRMIQKALSFQNLLDDKRAIRYVNEQFRVKHKFAEGGVAYYAERFKKRRE